MPIFRPSAFSWQCDKCKAFFKVGSGGVCTSCKRALCDRHLYGSLIEKVKAKFSSKRPVCVECRAAN